MKHLIGVFALVVAASMTGRARAQHELRLQPVGMASHFTQGETDDYDDAASLRVGAGGRLFFGSHGLVMDIAYTYDVPASFVNFGSDDRFEEAYLLGHLGYAFRRFVPMPRKPERRRVGFTAHASLSVGYAATEYLSDGVAAESELVQSTDPVIGGRFGADIDLHFGRYFVGWGLDVDLLRHLRPQRGRGGPRLERSVLLGHNIVPFFRMGITLGNGS